MEEAFEKRYNPTYKKGHIAHLHNPGEYLDDIDIMNLFYLMAWKKDYKSSDVRIIDSLVVDGIMNDRESVESSWLYIKNLFTQNLTPILLVPIYHATHWSLLYYRSSTNRWTHMDSLHPSSHSLYIRKVLGKLSAPSYNSPLKLWQGKIHHFPTLCHQPQSWECGYYLLLYMLIAVDAIDDNEIEEKIYLTGEGERKRMTKSLLEILI